MSESDHSKSFDKWKYRMINYRGDPMPYDIYKELLEYQQHKCAVCGSDEDAILYVDYDIRGETEEVMGLLCKSCSLASEMYEHVTMYLADRQIEDIKKYYADLPINHIPTSLKYGWKYEAKPLDEWDKEWKNELKRMKL